MRTGITLLLTVVLNLAYAIVFVSTVQYALNRQFEETILFLGMCYALASILTNVGLAVFHYAYTPRHLPAPAV